MPKHINPITAINNMTYRCKTCISAMLLRSDLNKWRLTTLEKLDRLYINSISTAPFHISKIDFFKYNNQIFPNKTHKSKILWCYVIIYFFLYSFRIKNSKMGMYLNCCSDCLGMNAPDLKLSKQLDLLFPAFLHKIKFRIFQR